MNIHIAVFPLILITALAKEQLTFGSLSTISFLNGRYAQMFTIYIDVLFFPSSILTPSEKKTPFFSFFPLSKEKVIGTPHQHAAITFCADLFQKKMTSRSLFCSLSLFSNN